MAMSDDDVVFSTAVWVEGFIVVAGYGAIFEIVSEVGEAGFQFLSGQRGG